MTSLEIISVPSFRTVPAWRAFLSLAKATVPGPVRVFADQGLQDSLDRVLASLPKDAKAVEVDVAGDANGVHGVIAYKTPGGWSILGGAFYDKSRQWGWQVGARKVWR